MKVELTSEEIALLVSLLNKKRREIAERPIIAEKNEVDYVVETINPINSLLSKLSV